MRAVTSALRCIGDNGRWIGATVAALAYSRPTRQQLILLDPSQLQESLENAR